MITVHLVRHGQTDWNLQRRLQGQTDIPLNATGRDQARRLAERFRGSDVGAVFSSDLERAVETARPLADELGLPVNVTPLLRERSFGVVEGRVEPELLEEVGESLRRYWSDPDLAFERGESRRQIYERVGRYLRELLAEPPSDELVIVSHGGTLNMVRGFLEGLTVEQTPHYGFENGAVTTLRVDPGSVGSDAADRLDQQFG